MSGFHHLRSSDPPLNPMECELVWGVQAALGLTQDEQRNGGIKGLLQQPLMGRGVRGVEKSLVDLLAFGRCLRQGELIVIETALHIARRLQEILGALAMRTDDRLMVNLQE